MTRKENCRRRITSWHFYLVIAISALALLGAASGLTHLVSGQATASAFANELIRNDSTLSVPPSILPNRVYVLDNREVVAELPPGEKGGGWSTGEGCASTGGTVFNSATVGLSGMVLPSRLIVVDEDDRITEIWSNTTAASCPLYSLRINEASVHGEEHPLTQQILAQYDRLYTVGRFPNETSALVMVFSLLEEERVKWQKVGMRAEDIVWIEEATKALEQEPIRLKFLGEALVV